MTRRVHVACDHELLRKSIAAFLDGHPTEVRVIRTSPEGEQGLQDVRGTDADVLVLGIPPEEDLAKHTEWYRRALPEAGLVGFCVKEEQAEEFRQAGVHTIVFTHSTGSELLEAIRAAKPKGN